MWRAYCYVLCFNKRLDIDVDRLRSRWIDCHRTFALRWIQNLYIDFLQIDDCMRQSDQ